MNLLYLGECEANHFGAGPTLPRVAPGMSSASWRRVQTEKLSQLSGSRCTGRQTCSVEATDLGSLTEISEFVEALDRSFGWSSDTRKNSVNPPNKNKKKLKMAVLDLSEGDATKLLELGHFRVGFVSCAVRLRTVDLRCFKSLGYRAPGQRVHCGGTVHSMFQQMREVGL